MSMDGVHWQKLYSRTTNSTRILKFGCLFQNLHKLKRSQGISPIHHHRQCHRRPPNDPSWHLKSTLEFVYSTIMNFSISIPGFLRCIAIPFSTPSSSFVNFRRKPQHHLVCKRQTIFVYKTNIYGLIFFFGIFSGGFLFPSPFPLRGNQLHWRCSLFLISLYYHL